MNAYDQNIQANHFHCVQWDSEEAWWFDNGELCAHQDWHN